MKAIKDIKYKNRDHILLYSSTYTLLCKNNKLLQKFDIGPDRDYIVKEYMKIINIPLDTRITIQTKATYDYRANHSNHAKELIAKIKRPDLVRTAAYLAVKKSFKPNKIFTYPEFCRISLIRRMHGMKSIMVLIYCWDYDQHTTRITWMIDEFNWSEWF